MEMSTHDEICPSLVQLKLARWAALCQRVVPCLGIFVSSRLHSRAKSLVPINPAAVQNLAWDEIKLDGNLGYVHLKYPRLRAWPCSPRISAGVCCSKEGPRPVTPWSEHTPRRNLIGIQKLQVRVSPLARVRGQGSRASRRSSGNHQDDPQIK